MQPLKLPFEWHCLLLYNVVHLWALGWSQQSFNQHDFEINLDQSQINTLCTITLEVWSLPFQASFEACDHLLKDVSISNKCWIYVW